MRKALTYLFLIVAGYFLFFHGTGGCGLFDVDEAVYAGVSMEMMKNGSFIVPTYNGLPFYEKPVLYYWTTAVFYKLFGVSEITARIPGGVFAVLMVLGTWYFVRRMFNSRTALLSAVILSTNVEMLILSKSAVMDTMFVFFVTGCLVSFALAFFNEKKGGYMAVYLFAALAVLTKGPAGIVLPGVIIFIFLLLAGEVSKVKRLLNVPGIIIFLVTALPWYVLVSVASGGDFLKEFFMYHNVARFTRSFEGHSGTVFYYLGVILLGFYPWSAFLPAGITGAVKSLMKDKKNLFLIVWMVIPFVFFSISYTKLPNYALPIFPPMSVLVAVWWNKYIDGNNNGPLVTIHLVIFSVISIFWAGLFTFSRTLADMVRARFNLPYMAEPATFGISFKVLAAGFVLFLIIVFILEKFRRREYSIAVLAMGMFLFNYALTDYVIPVLWQYTQGGLHRISTGLRHKLNDESILVIYELRHPSINFYTRSRAEILTREEKARFEHILSHGKINNKRIYIISGAKLKQGMPAEIKVLQESGGYVLLSNM